MDIGLDNLALARDAVQKASKIVVLSGAGISKASGIPTYRDTGGLWDNAETSRFSHVDGFVQDPRAFQKFWRDRSKGVVRAKPNPAHFALANLQKTKPLTTLITQNIDGLLQKAGAGLVHELHGSLVHTKCHSCGTRTKLTLFGRCWRCKGYLRPEVTMFGEALNADVYSAAARTCVNAELFIVVGTTALVEPAAQLPVNALRFGAKLMVINPEQTIISMAADYDIRGKAEEILPGLIN